MKRIAWCSPFGPGSGIGFFSRKVLPIFAARARQLGWKVDLWINENGPRYELPDQVGVFSFDQPITAEQFRKRYDCAIYCMGNNEKNHYQIFSLLKNVPGVVLQMDIVNQHLLVEDLLDRKKSPELYYFLMVELYGSAARDAALEGIRCSQGRGPRIPPWDSADAAAFPLFEVSTRLASTVLTQSKFAYQRIRGRGAAPATEMQNPFDLKEVPSAFSVLAPQLQGASDTLQLASFGVIQTGKQIDKVLRAIACSELLRASVLYTIVGYPEDPSYLAYLKSLVSALGLERNVAFLLSASDEQLLHVLEETDAFVNIRFPNTESGSGSLIEQLGSGRPVIILDSGCFADVPDGCAIKVESHEDIQGIAEAIESCVTNRTELDEVGIGGLKWAASLKSKDYADVLIDTIISNQFRQTALSLLSKTIDSKSACFVDDVDIAAACRWTGRLLGELPVKADSIEQFKLDDSGRYFEKYTGVNLEQHLRAYVEHRILVQKLENDHQNRSPYMISHWGQIAYIEYLEDVVLESAGTSGFWLEMFRLYSESDNVHLHEIVAGLIYICEQRRKLKRGDGIHRWDMSVEFAPEVWILASKLNVEFFVELMYAGLLMKLPDAGGFQHYVQDIKQRGVEPALLAVLGDVEPGIEEVWAWGARDDLYRRASEGFGAPSTNFGPVSDNLRADLIDKIRMCLASIALPAHDIRDLDMYAGSLDDAKLVEFFLIARRIQLGLNVPKADFDLELDCRELLRYSTQLTNETVAALYCSGIGRVAVGSAKFRELAGHEEGLARIRAEILCG